MGAIAAIWRFDGHPVHHSDLELMLHSDGYPESDSKEVLADGMIGLGHRRRGLASVVSRTQALPADRDGRLVVAADVRLDNREVLLDALTDRGALSREPSDSELLLAAYERWGEGCPEKLFGDFAFAIWDRYRQRLFCARDHFGVKPFYYHRTTKLFACACEIRALTGLPMIPRTLNKAKVADFLTDIELDGVFFAMEDKVSTFYHDIYRLPPGHSLTITRGQQELRSYWSLDPSRELPPGSDQEYAEAFRQLFWEATRCRLRDAAPVGSMLSGGLDSSVVTCVARELLAPQRAGSLQTFTATFDTLPQCDERPLVNAVLASTGLEPHFLRADLLSPLADLDRIFLHVEEPFDAPNLFIHWGLYKLAAERNVRTLFEGIDGDSIVSHGIGLLPELARGGRWRTLANELFRLSLRFNSSPARFLSRRGISFQTPEVIRQAWGLLHRRNQHIRQVNPILRSDFATRTGVAERVEALRDRPYTPPRTARESHWHHITSGKIPMLLEVYGKAAAAFNVELRYPFLDARLAEFCLALPADQKLSEGWTRIVVRRAMEGILPESVRWNGGKANVFPNFDRSLRRLERERMDRVMLVESQCLGEFVDLDALREIHHRYIQHGDEDDAVTIWKSLILTLWIQQAELAS